MKFTNILMVWILLLLPLAARVSKCEGQITEKTVNETSTELVPYLGNLDPIPEIADTKPTSDSPHLLSTDSGDS